MTTNTALAEFIATAAQVTAQIELLSNYADRMFDTDPDIINWGDVGNLTHMRAVLADLIAFSGVKQ